MSFKFGKKILKLFSKNQKEQKVRIQSDKKSNSFNNFNLLKKIKALYFESLLISN